MDYIDKHFLELERDHYSIINNYIMGKVTKEEYDKFAEKLFKTRSLIDSYNPKDDEILKIAKMKSRIQHYITDTLEEEDLLKSIYN